MVAHRLSRLLVLAAWGCSSAEHRTDLHMDASSGGVGTGGAPVAGGSAAPTGVSGASALPGGSTSGNDGGETAVDPVDAGPEDGAPRPEDAGARSPVRDPEPVGCVTNVTAGVHHFDCDGIGYDLTVPEQCVGFSCGLIVDVHGGTMSGPMEDKNTNLSALGQQHGYFVITPSAPAGLWDALRDDPKVLVFIESVVDAFVVDRNRVHMTGMSQGGYMTWRFLCAHTDLFASVAPAAAAGAANISLEVGCTFTGSDVPSGEVDILYIHGRQDGLVNYDNAVTLRDAVTAFYGAGPAELVAGDDQYRRVRYALPEGHVFEFIDHDYVSDSVVGLPPLAGVALLGHCFPGSDDLTVTLPGQLMSFGCNPPNAFKWGEEVMRFFREHPRR